MWAAWSSVVLKWSSRSSSFGSQLVFRTFTKVSSSSVAMDFSSLSCSNNISATESLENSRACFTKKHRDNNENVSSHLSSVGNNVTFTSGKTFNDYKLDSQQEKKKTPGEHNENIYPQMCDCEVLEMGNIRSSGPVWRFFYLMDPLICRIFRPSNGYSTSGGGAGLWWTNQSHGQYLLIPHVFSQS